MQIQFGEATLEPGWKNSIVCMGTLDSIHLGHQALINQTVKKAIANECPSVVVTFNHHPLMVVAPERVPVAISSLSENLRLLEKLGVNVVVVLDFNEKLRETTAQQFFDRILIQKLLAKSCIVGEDFHFGANREGTPEWLKSRIQTEVIAPVLHEGLRISSSRIRQAISSGNFTEAAQLLGRNWSFDGIVVSGEKQGRTIGYPTINLVSSQAVITPPDGVFVGLAHTQKGTFSAAISVGTRPTMELEDRLIEAYLIDFPGDNLYGTNVRLDFLSQVRDQEKFDSIERLTSRIALDVLEVRNRTRR